MSIGDNTIAAYAAELMDLEDAVDAAQGDKKFFFESAREAHGKDFVKSLKLAVKVARTEPEKLQQAEAIEAEAERILGIIRQSLVAHGARTREIIEEFDGSRTVESAAFGADDPRPASSAGMEGDEDRQPIQSSGERELSVSTPAATGIELGDSAPSVERTPEPSNVTPIRKQWKHSDPAHPDCRNPGQCGGFSNSALCRPCMEAAEAGQVA